MNDRPLSRRSVSAFWRNSDGVSAIEFSLILPVLLAMLFGMIELGHGYDNSRKVTQLARVVADLTSQGDTTSPIRASTMTDILASSRLILRPFDSSKVKIVVSALGVDLLAPTGRPRVCSSVTNATATTPASDRATARAVGLANDLTIPSGFQLAGMRYLLVETNMSYVPVFASRLVQRFGGFNNLFTFNVVLPWPVRGGRTYGTNTYNEVVLPSGSACP